ncbi:glycoside hydrolase family 108 protein [Acinetobacter baumannii]
MKIEQYLDELIKREGGYVNNPADRGGATKYGITEAVARENGYKGSMKDLPLDVAKSIYKQQYWTAPRFDQVNAVSSAVAEELLDTGVNCGTGFAKPLLQRALNLLRTMAKQVGQIYQWTGFMVQQLLMHLKLI